MTTMELERRCDNCLGGGSVTAPEWRDYWQCKEAETVEWPAGPEPTVPEEWMCDTCMGRGTVLTEEGQAIAALIHRILDEREEASSFRNDRAEEIAARKARQQDAALFEAHQRADDAYYEAQRLRDRVTDIERKGGW